MKTFTASDLSQQRRAVLEAGRGSGALVRDTDGEVVVVVPASLLNHLERIGDLSRSFVALTQSLEADAVSPAALADFAWAAQWPRARRARLAREIGDAIALAVSLKDPAPVEAVLDRCSPPLHELNPRFDGEAMWKVLSEGEHEQLAGRRTPKRRRLSK